MSAQRDLIPAAWVWSQYKGSFDDNVVEVPLAWVWSQYSPVTTLSEIPVAAQSRNFWDNKFICAAAALGILLTAAFYLDSPTTDTSRYITITNAETANDQISKALSYLKEAYRMNPREETQKLIIQLEKIPKK